MVAVPWSVLEAVIALTAGLFVVRTKRDVFLAEMARGQSREPLINLRIMAHCAFAISS